jgi:hypothetical protein
MHHGVDRLGAQIGVKFVQAGIMGERVEHLAGIGDVGDEGARLGVVQRLGVEVQDLVAVIEQNLQRMLACLAAAAGKYNSLHIQILPPKFAHAESIAGAAAGWKDPNAEGFPIN